MSELKEELEDRGKVVAELEEERISLAQQVQIALARADSEALARSIAEETVTDLEKEKTIKELEMKDVMGKHRADISTKEASISSVSLVQVFVRLARIRYEVSNRNDSCSIVERPRRRAEKAARPVEEGKRGEYSPNNVAAARYVHVWRFLYRFIVGRRVD